MADFDIIARMTPPGTARIGEGRPAPEWVSKADLHRYGATSLATRSAAAPEA